MDLAFQDELVSKSFLSVHLLPPVSSWHVSSFGPLCFYLAILALTLDKVCIAVSFKPSFSVISEWSSNPPSKNKLQLLILFIILKQGSTTKPEPTCQAICICIEYSLCVQGTGKYVKVEKGKLASLPSCKLCYGQKSMTWY